MFDDDCIYSYTRAQAIADGILKDASGMAREAGFTIPVALTAAAWFDCVEWDAEDALSDASQSETGRLWDVLNVAQAIARCYPDSDRLAFTVSRIPRRGYTISREVKLLMTVGPGDDYEPVITIGFSEDF